nr:calycin-like domain-containing protein [uncultured Bacteroides sp.]
MKKNLFYLFALVCSLSLFTACSDDDEKLTLSQVIENNLAGIYTGTLDITSNGMPIGTQTDQSITLSKSSSATDALKLELKDFDFIPDMPFDITVEPCVVTQNGDEYTFKGSQEVAIPGLGNFPVNVEGVTDGKNVEIKIVVSDVPMFNTVNVSFTGVK